MNNPYVLCVTYCLESRNGDSVGGEEDIYFESATVAGCVDKLRRFAATEQPHGQTLFIMGWCIAEVVMGSEDCIDE